MPRSQAEKAESHEKIVKVAGTQFREKGLGGIGVANVMAAAGLTHGGFYCHFKSRRHLVEETLQRVFEDSEQIKDASVCADRAGLIDEKDKAARIGPAQLGGVWHGVAQSIHHSV